MRGVTEKLLQDVTTAGSASLWRDTYGQPYLTTIVQASGTAPSGTLVWEGSPGRFDSNNVVMGPDPGVVYNIQTISVSSGVAYSAKTEGHRFIRHRLSSVANSVGGPVDAPSGVFTTWVLGIGSVNAI